eukprot:1039962-Prymnesium_polylepis.2
MPKASASESAPSPSDTFSEASGGGSLDRLPGRSRGRCRCTDVRSIAGEAAWLPLEEDCVDEREARAPAVVAVVWG